jgi:hypothetical protein
VVTEKLVYSSEILANVTLAVLLICSIERSLWSKVIPRHFPSPRNLIVDNLNSDKRLCKRQVKITAIVFSRL